MNNHKLLMIEDDLDDRYITETYFAQMGHKVEIDFFEGSADVIAHLSSLDEFELPDLIVIDPGKRGFESLQQLKTHEQFKAIPIIVVSELTTESKVKEAYRLGANSFIEKPSTHALTSEKIGTFAKYWFETVEL
jgi:CheY-like chemotaxis protein